MNSDPLIRTLPAFGRQGWIALGALALMVPLAGAPERSGTPAPAASIAADSKGGVSEAEVRAALRAGDVAAADRILDDVVETERAAGSVQLPAQRRAVEILAGIAFSSCGGAEHAVAVRAATAILARADRAKLEDVLDRAAVAEIAGEMAERILGDREAARRWYEAALQENPNADTSRLGLARLGAFEAAQTERSREIEAAHRRAAEQPPLPQPTPSALISAAP